MLDPTPEAPSTVVDLDADTNCVYLHRDTDLKLAVTLGQADRPNEINGETVKYFWADAIVPGTYQTRNRKTGKMIQLSVDRNRIDGWIRNFGRMRENGVKVPINTEHSSDATRSLGYVKDMKRDGDTLKILHQFIGDDAIKMASRNEISIGINPNFEDGRGQKYGDAIFHSALTMYPVVPGQSGLIAASRGPQSEEPVILFLSAPSNGGADMALADQIEQLRTLPGAENANPEDPFKYVLDYATANVENVKTLLSRAEGAESERDGLQSQIVTLSREDAPVLPSQEQLHYLGMCAEIATTKAIEGGASPNCLTEARKSYLGAQVDTSTLTLSRKVEEADGHISQGLKDYIRFAELLKLNKPVRGSDVKPGDVAELSRTTGEEDDEWGKSIKASVKPAAK